MGGVGGAMRKFAFAMVAGLLAFNAPAVAQTQQQQPQPDVPPAEAGVVLMGTAIGLTVILIDKKLKNKDKQITQAQAPASP